MEFVTATLEAFGIRLLDLLHNAENNNRLTEAKNALDTQFGAHLNAVVQNTDAFELIRLFDSGLHALEIMNGIDVTNASNAEGQAPDGIPDTCYLSKEEEGQLRDILFDDYGKVISVEIPIMMFPDKNGRPMLSYKRFMELCPDLPGSIE